MYLFGKSIEKLGNLQILNINGNINTSIKSLCKTNIKNLFQIGAVWLVLNLTSYICVHVPFMFMIRKLPIVFILHLTLEMGYSILKSEHPSERFGNNAHSIFWIQTILDIFLFILSLLKFRQFLCHLLLAERTHRDRFFPLLLSVVQAFTGEFSPREYYIDLLGHPNRALLGLFPILKSDNSN